MGCGGGGWPHRGKHQSFPAMCTDSAPRNPRHPFPVHNIPEGIVVGVPVYFATGSRLRAVLWAAVAGLAEILGALVGLAVVKTDSMNDTAMGVIMGLVAGIMLFISLMELLPRWVDGARCRAGAGRCGAMSTLQARAAGQ